MGDRKVGAIGDFTCFSLYATKSLAGGEGGVVTTASDEFAARLRLLRAHGITRDPWLRQQTRTLGHYDVLRPGFKANLADLQAAVALPKIDRVGELRARREALVDRYDAGSPRWPASSRSAARSWATTPTIFTSCGSTRSWPEPTATATPRR